MHLDELSEQEREYVSQNSSGTRQLLIDESSGEAAKAHDQDYDSTSERWPKPSDAQESSRQNSSFRPRRKPSNPFVFHVKSALDRLRYAARILQFVDESARISFHATQIFTVVRDAPRELQVLSNRIMQYTKLLQTGTEVIRTSMAIGELQILAWEVIQDSLEVIRDAFYIIEKFKPERGQQLLRYFKRQSNKKYLEAAIEKIESLKSTLTFMLQLHQVNLAERNLHAIRSASVEVSPRFAKDRELRRR